MRPLRASFGDATRLLISPDGALNLVPFEAFVDEDGRYLIERYATSYLTSGRDLLRLQVTSTSQNASVVIVADPFFGEPAMTGGARPLRQPARARAGSVTIGDDLSTMYFAPLAGTAAEARAINALFPEADAADGTERDEGGGRAPRVAAHSPYRVAWILPGSRASRIRCCDPGWRWPAPT